MSALDTPPALPAEYLQAGATYYDIDTTAVFVAPVTVCVSYDATSVAEPVRLALSLHAPDGMLRSELMPVNDRYPLADVLEACAAKQPPPPPHLLKG